MSELKDAYYWINTLSMTAHPEGGYFKETFRADEQMPASVLPARYQASRTLSTSIYFLLTTESVSKFHRLNSDEIWHFHFGGAGRIHFLSERGYEYRDIGSDLEQGRQFQVVIPRGSWFAAEVIEGDYILVGCTVAPGFEFADFELANGSSLKAEYADHKALIERFT